MEKQKYNCSVCSKTSNGRIPFHGDGSMVYPYRHHDENGNPCEGNILEAIPFDSKASTPPSEIAKEAKERFELEDDVEKLAKDYAETVSKLFALQEVSKHGFIAGYNARLSNPSPDSDLMEKVKEADVFKFVEWADNNATQNSHGFWYSSILKIEPKNGVSTKELFKIYKNSLTK